MPPSLSTTMPRIAALAACFAVATLAAGCATSPTPVAGAANTAVVPQAIPGLRAPRPGLLTAGQPAAADWHRLADDGVATVVNLRPEAEMQGRDARAEVTGAGMAYHAIPVAGASDLSDANAAALWQLLEGAEGTVLVHCASANRAGALLAIGAARSGAMGPVEALAFGKSAGLTSPALEAAVRGRLGLELEAPAAGD
ncbi:beta-lactamase hydrolase domain-containing protein [Luteimonas saliphila]|uniref:beta-lactamase hydrolase domain-containing protein n=1 Tax=Luteimonas saliphila TaxID=2804919 RepID=UPI00192D7E90|nr:sulfur transferase domain-containing protein [Luteimonas saliphila]